jgi:uncharacterized protein (DUF58 family)
MPTQDLFKHIRRLEIVSRRLVQTMLAGNYLSAFHGQGLEFEEVREYQPGDEVRSIDWNVTARQGRPFVKVFREERELSVLFAVDISGSAAFGSKGSSKRELAARLVASLGLAAAGNGDRVGLLLFSDRVELALPARRGRAAVLRAVREVLNTPAQGRCTLFSPAARRLPSLGRRGAIVFWISDLMAPDAEQALGAASMRYDVVACRLHDPLEWELPAGLGLLACADPETGQRYLLDTDSRSARKAWAERAMAWRKEGERMLRGLQIDNLELATDQEISDPLLRFFRARERRVR